MTAPLGIISQVKLQIKQIVESLQKLDHGLETNSGELKNNTEHLLNKLENLPLENLSNKLQKRQGKRRNKKLKKLKMKDYIKRRNTAIVELENDIKVMKSVTREPKQQQFRSIKESQRFLQTFELLEHLHLLRGQNPTETYKFSYKLRQLKSIWNCLLQDKLQEQTSADIKIQQQWNEVFFGPPEKKYFEEKPNLQDFVRKRQIWDSYIDSKYGTFIPIGWIIPDAEGQEQWRQYLTPIDV